MSGLYPLNSHLSQVDPFMDEEIEYLKYEYFAGLVQ